MKTYVIDGVTYVESAREAEVGDKIRVLNSEWVPDNCIGKIYDVTEVTKDLIYTEGRYLDGSVLNLWRKEYRVLEPVESEELSQATPGVLDMLANLARRVTSLESQLSDTQRNAEMLAEELMALKYLTQSNEGDIRMIDQRTQVIDAINKYYAEGSR